MAFHSGIGWFCPSWDSILIADLYLDCASPRKRSLSLNIFRNAGVDILTAIPNMNASSLKCSRLNRYPCSSLELFIVSEISRKSRASKWLPGSMKTVFAPTALIPVSCNLHVSAKIVMQTVLLREKKILFVLIVCCWSWTNNLQAFSLQSMIKRIKSKCYWGRCMQNSAGGILII